MLPLSARAPAVVSHFKTLSWKRVLRASLVPVCILLFVVLSGVGLYWRSNVLMQQHLREYLRTTAAVGALEFDGDALRKINTKNALQAPAYKRVVKQLQEIRNEVPSIRYAYIMARTKDPMTLEFLADADSLSTKQELDRNGNGTVDEDEEPSYPGDLYDISEIPELKGQAFVEATVDPAVTVDPWGRLISGYAPIRDSQQRVVGVLGIDMQADAFEQLSQSIFSIDVLMLLFFAGVVLASYSAIELRRRQLEARAQLEVDRRALMDLASHQLGAPLTTFKWWLEILRERDGGKLCRDTDICVQMEEGIKRMDAIIRALRSAETGKSPEGNPVCDLHAAVSQAVEEAGVQFKHREQTCTVDLPADLPALRVDGALLEGAIEEMLENASSYSDHGTEIIVRARRTGSAVKIEIIDHGDGIPREELPHIMEKFTRGKTAFGRKPVGNGLGLWIVKSIIEHAGGKIWIESVQHRGTTMHLALPIA